MHRIIKLTCVVTVMLITGCASSGYLVQYDSTPQSAMVICNGTQQGYTPLNLYYPRTSINGSGELYTQACQAVWASGASENYSQHIDTTKFPDGIKITAQRPKTEGFSTDATADYQKKMNDEQIRQRNQQSFNESMRAMQPKHTYCNQIGTQIFCNTY